MSLGLGEEEILIHMENLLKLLLTERLKIDEKLFHKSRETGQLKSNKTLLCCRQCICCYYNTLLKEQRIMGGCKHTNSCLNLLLGFLDSLSCITFGS